jgi:phospholipase/carboxylesterase
MLIDGPRIAPSSGKTDTLVVLLHGYGSNGNDLIQLAGMWRGLAPNALWIAPNAPEPVPGALGGFQWFPIEALDPRLLARGVESVAPNLDRFVDRELEKAGLSADRLVLIGFSQGTMMALHVGLNRARDPLAVIGFSGALTSPPKEPLTARPPILLVHGDKDDMVPVAASLAAAEALCKAGHAASFHISAGAGHTIAPDGLDVATQFLRQALAGQLKSEPVFIS